jgi:hypothetical protein
VISPNKPVRNSIRDKQDVCPGYHENGAVPVGCFVTKDIIIAMSVIPIN